jgi:hypothetical protein
MRVTERFARSDLASDDIKRILDRAAELGFSAVSFTGGEPLLRLDDLVAFIQYADKAGFKYIRTGTNGFLLRQVLGPQFAGRVRELAEKLAATPLRNLWISVDSADPDTHERMRGLPGVFGAIEKAVPIFHDCGLYPSANLGINRNVGGEATASLSLGRERVDPWQRLRFERVYRQSFRRFFRRVIDMGFTIVSACYPMSGEADAVYAATSDDDVVRYTAAETACLYRALLATVGDFRQETRVFTPRSSLHALCGQYSASGADAYPCRGGVDFFFVDSRDGNAYPCGYRGDECLGKLWEWTGLPRAEADCRRCDWECFRDPSELVGPLLEGLANPIGLWKRFRADRTYFRYWVDDLRYYRACRLFDGRRPPQPARLREFHDRTLRAEHEHSDRVFLSLVHGPGGADREPHSGAGRSPRPQQALR